MLGCNYSQGIKYWSWLIWLFKLIFDMTSATTASLFFSSASAGPESGPSYSSHRPVFSKFNDARRIRWKTNLQTTSSLNLNRATFRSDGYEDLTNIIFPDKRYVVFDRKLKQPSEQTVGKYFNPGRYLPNSAIFRQHYSVRAYEIGPTGKISFEALMNLLQETSINSIKCMGLEVDRMGSTPEMRKMNLIWVATKAQIVIDRYPSCEDVLEVDSWIVMAENNCMRRDATIRDCKTGKTLLRASSIFTTMNAETRIVGKIPEEVRAEMGCYLIDELPVVKEDIKQMVKLDEATAGYICSDLKPTRGDLDFKQHVNSTNYIGWILESVPSLLLEDHELSYLTMEYIRECNKSNVLKSLTSVTGGTGGGGYVEPLDIECSHLLKIENGPEIMKAKSQWKPKQANDLVNYF